jgi:predicted nucleic acid-binding protein
VIEPGPLIDTGPLVALMVERDPDHQACAEMLAQLRPPLLSCWPVLTEAAWLLRRYPDGLDRLFDAVESGMVVLLDIEATALPTIAKFLRRYESIGAQLAEACLIHLAEREGIGSIFTLDRRDFSVYRLKGNRALTLLP